MTEYNSLDISVHALKLSYGENFVRRLMEMRKKYRPLMELLSNEERQMLDFTRYYCHNEVTLQRRYHEPMEAIDGSGTEPDLGRD